MMIVRCEVSDFWLMAATGRRHLRDVLQLANRIAGKIGMPDAQRRRQKILIVHESLNERYAYSPAYVDPDKPEEVVIQTRHFFRSLISDFEAALIEELQHAIDFAQGIGLSEKVAFGGPYHASHLTEFRAVVQMARLRPIRTVKKAFRKAIAAVVEDSRIKWCATIDSEHLRQAVINAELASELVRSLVSTLHAASLELHASAIEELIKEDHGANN